jgi:hypothetical protein
MFDQLFETFRKASESSLQLQQDFFKQWLQATPFANGNQADWSQLSKRWQEQAAEALNKHRALLDSSYRSGIEMIEQSFRVSEARSPEDYRRLIEDLWRKLTDTFKMQTEAQARDFQSATEKWMDKTRASSERAPS